MNLYRYQDHKSTEGFYVHLYEYRVLRETKACFVIDIGLGDKFVSKIARKRFAYPTIEQAKESFEIRKKKQLAYRQRDLDYIQGVVWSINEGTVYNKDRPFVSIFSEWS
jgi:hypothetical protein